MYNIYESSSANRHKVFVSYHHANDQSYRDQFEGLFAQLHEIMVSRSVQIGDIPEGTNTERIRQIIRDQYLHDSTVTVVLIGSETWQRKHVDWEIGSSIRQTQYNYRSGLLGILLPTYSIGLCYSPERTENGASYNPKTIPPRLYENVQCGFAKIYNWSYDPNLVKQWIHEAFKRRDNIQPDNSFPSFVNNRYGTGWQR